MPKTVFHNWSLGSANIISQSNFAGRDICVRMSKTFSSVIALLLYPFGKTSIATSFFKIRRNAGNCISSASTPEVPVEYITELIFFCWTRGFRVRFILSVSSNITGYIGCSFTRILYPDADIFSAISYRASETEGIADRAIKILPFKL